MIVDGKAIANKIFAEIKAEIKDLSAQPRLTIFTCSPAGETLRYLKLKMRRGKEVGIDVNVIELPADSGTGAIRQSIAMEAPKTDGIIVQLPLPKDVDVDAVLSSMPEDKDIDAALYKGGDSKVMPPVVGAIAEIATHHQVDLSDKKVVVIGKGRLVGQPAALWAAGQNLDVTIVTKDTLNTEEVLQEADVIIAGAGVPGLVTTSKVKEGVLIFDAGTSEEGGVLKGDVDQAVSEKASLFTPVPGGIGPITLAVLFKNLVSLSKVHD